MKCHYIYDEEVGKVLIPGCWSVAIYNDMRRCTCRPPKTDTQRAEDERSRLIKELEAENARLNRLIKTLLKRR